MKDKIIEVALERFMQNGIRSMTIQKLIEPLGISTKTVYKYFKSKEELLEECLNLLYSGYFTEYKTLLNNNENPVVTLLLLFRSSLDKDFGVNHAFFHDLNYYYPDLQNSAIKKAEFRHNDQQIPLIENGIRDGYFHQYIQPDIALNGIVTLYTLITRSEQYRGFQGNPYDLFKNLVGVFIRGLCTEKGVKELENHPFPNYKI